ncbi:MAG: APC family permease [Candidatus Dormibacteraeota bacterium]|nr:APC family permease [Candidatus Dormibacteraeota bacterium]MBO0745572.1 APC family permease [Candidatus Dormibacteraeota bacterium]MBO0762616.1 APC family permease [Candidatus Dormibacteraeota bacterium]
MSDDIAKTGGDGGQEPVGSEVSRVAGATTLKRNTLSMPEVLAQSVANMAPSAALALLPLLVFLNAGNGAWASFLIAVILMACVGYCATQFAKRMESAGSFYVWVTRSLGPGWGYISGWGLQLGYLATGVATVLGVGVFGGDLIHRLVPGVDPLNLWLQLGLYAADIVIAVTLATTGVRISARTALTLESISIAAILTLVVTVLVVRGPIDVKQFTFTGVAPGGIVVGVVLAIFAFVGFESAGSLGMEAKNPYKNIGRAILWSAVIVGIFYVVVVYSQTAGFQPTNGGFAKSEAPMPDLAALLGFNWLAIIISAGITISALACTLACVNASSRIALTMAHDGIGVRALQRTHRTHKTPVAAILTVAVPMVAVPIIIVALHQSPIEGTGWVGTLATFGFMLGYALVALAAPLFMRRLNLPAVGVWIAGIVGFVAMIVVFYANWLPQTMRIPGIAFPNLEGVYVWLPYVFFAWVAIGLVWYGLVRYRSPHVAEALGSRYERPEEHTQLVG